MSDLNKALELFGFMTIDDVTQSSLKIAFKNKVLQAHPDKGGDADEFDNMLHSFLYLSQTFQRVSGGRKLLQNILSPDELKETLANIVVNKLFDEFVNDEFNKEFEKTHKASGHGYYDWLKNTSDENNLTIGKFGEATLKPPTFASTDLNKIFEETAKKDKPEPNSIILHPDAMAYVSGSVLGTEIIENTGGTYTSELFTNPEFTDLYAAFTTENTICDKVTSFNDKNKNIDELISEVENERKAVILPFNDTELKAIQEFERNKLEKDKQHLNNIKNYFNSDLSSEPQYIFNSSEGFIHQF
jgi:hypothetical protein